MKAETYPFVMRPLPYEYDGLAPALDDITLQFHHDRHYKGYVDGLNDALANYPELQEKSMYELLRNLGGLPDALKPLIRKNGGGAYCHELYFDSMKRAGWQEPEGKLKAAMERDFGSLKQWKEKTAAAAVGLFGSGWVFLVTDEAGNLTIMTTANQDLPDLRLFTPILALDVWEHAYYLQYQNRRAEYIEVWLKLVNWKKVSRRYDEVYKDERGELPEGTGEADREAGE